MSSDANTEGKALYARYESKCLEIIRQNPGAGAHRLMMEAIQAGFSMGAAEYSSRLLAELTIRSAKAA